MGNLESPVHSNVLGRLEPKAHEGEHADGKHVIVMEFPVF